MSYTYQHVLLPVAVPHDEIFACVAAAAPTFQGAYVDVAVAILKPHERATVLELHHRRGTSNVQGSAPSHGLPRELQAVQPFLLELGHCIARKQFATTVAFVTDQTEGYEVLQLSPRERAAVRTRRGGCLRPSKVVEYVWKGDRLSPDPDAEGLAAEMLGEVVGEDFVDTTAYLHWYAEWADLWFADNWRTVNFGDPILIVDEAGNRISPPQRVAWRKYWAHFYGDD